MRPLERSARRELVVGTRKSKLARWQTDYVVRRLREAWPALTCRVLEQETQGDRILDQPLPEIGGKGLFTEELERGLLSGEIDFAVHSLKDLPVEPAPGLVVVAVPEREDVRDALVSDGTPLDDLPAGAVVGTSSLRRQAQLLIARPDLEVRPVRGNVETRIDKARRGDYHAVVLAGAGLRRLGLEGQVSEWLTLERMLPAPGQGALAVQCRADDEGVRRLMAPLEHEATRRAVDCERSFLQALGGGCSVPVAAHARIEGERVLLEGLVASPSGRGRVRVSGEGSDAHELGARLAREAMSQGAADFLDERVADAG